MKVQMVSRLIEEEDVGATEERTGESDAHAPSAGEFARRLHVNLRFRLESESGEDGGCARTGFGGLDVEEALLNILGGWMS